MQDNFFFCLDNRPINLFLVLALLCNFWFQFGSFVEFLNKIETLSSLSIVAFLLRKEIRIL